MKSLGIALLVVALATPARADLLSKAIRETAEFAMKKFAREMASEGVEQFSSRLLRATTRHGDDILHAVRKAGPRALTLADEAAEKAPAMVKLLSRHGDDAVRAVGNPRGMALFSKFGDDAAEVMIRHKGIAEPLLEAAGGPAVKALGSLGPRAGRRLAMMHEAGELAQLGRTPELLKVIARGGDRVMEFVWKNKAALALSATFAAFLADPEGFMSGVRETTVVVSEKVIAPVAQTTRVVVQETASVAKQAIQTTGEVAGTVAKEVINTTGNVTGVVAQQVISSTGTVAGKMAEPLARPVGLVIAGLAAFVFIVGCLKMLARAAMKGLVPPRRP
jgi:hypothetical protein